jgi:flagellar biosynthetic protein FlhB
LFAAALIGPAALGGWLFSAKALAPKASRINPLSGIKRMFSAQSMVELVKGVCKVTVLGGAGILILDYLTPNFLDMREQATDVSVYHAVKLLAWVSFALSATTILIVIIDVPYQLWDHAKKLKMTLQEVKDEMKDSEGKPEVKGRIRQLQQEMANRRMMEAVPQADVVITNPTHFSVALQYDPAKPGAPVVIAKGVDFMAIKIREIAAAHDVIMLEAPPLARAVYYTTEVDGEIPDGLYLSVAQVLAYVFQLKSYKPGKNSKKPRAPKGYDIPDDMVYNERGEKPNSSN